MTRIRFSSLRARLLLVLLLMTAMPALLVGLLAYRNARYTAEMRAIAQLTSVADAKKKQIAAWFDLTRADSRLLADNFLNQEHFAEIIDPQTDLRRRDAFAGFVTDNLISLQRTHAGYTEIMFVDAMGRVVLSTDPTRIGADLSADPAVVHSLASASGEYVGDVHREAASGQIEMTFGHSLPAVDLATETLLPRVNGAVIIRVNMQQTIYPLLGSWPGMGKTAETLLARMDGDSILFLNPLLFDEDAALKLRIPSDSPNAKPAYLGSHGQEGIIRTPDYRGVLVLAAYRFIPQADWGFVIKEDQAEAFASVADLTRQWMTITVLVLLAAVIVAIALSRTLTGPLARLALAAQNVASGQFSNDLRLRAPATDELAQLADAFQRMVLAVQEREAALKTRAEELGLLNQLGRDIAATLDLHEIAAHVTSRVAGRYDNFLSQLLLYDPVSQELVAYAASGRNAAAIHLGECTWLGQGLLGLAALDRQTQFANHPSAQPGFVPLPGVDQRAQIAVPIMREGELLGVLGVSSDHLHRFGAGDVLLLETLASQLAPAIENVRLFRDLGDSYDHILDALVAALDARDKETEGHSRRVVLFTLALARQLDVPSEEMDDLRRGALLHDIGKIGLPDTILLKPGPLTDEERAVMHNHPEWGRRILDGIPFLEGALEIVCAHQEHWDGTGYPRGLAGASIPFGARIFAVADAFDAITSDRPYRPGQPYTFARQEILDGRGIQFDASVVDAFLQIPEADWARLRVEALEMPISGIPYPSRANGQGAWIAPAEFEALNQLVVSLRGSLDLDEIMQEAARTLVENLGVAATGIFLFDPDTDQLKLAAEYGLPDPIKQRFPQFPVAGFHNERVVRQSCTVLHNSIEEVTEFVNLGLPISQPDWGSYLCVPLTANGEVTGIMGVLSRLPHTFERRDVYFFQALGEQIGLAVLNARSYEFLHKIAVTDDLTGIHNRRSLDDSLRIEFQRCIRYQHAVAIIMLDIDQFKTYNDAYGHLAGDEALRQIAGLLQKSVRTSDVVARYGGEEFTIILPETDSVGATNTAEKLRAAIATHTFPHGRLTSSFGVAHFTASAASHHSPDTLLRMADQALYKAKQIGRNCIAVWNPHWVSLPDVDDGQRSAESGSM